MSSQENTQKGAGIVLSYIIGFVLSLIFVSVAYGITVHHALSNAALYTSLAVLAVVTVISQVIFFLRLNSVGGGSWNVMALLFTVIVIVIVVSGSLWIMHNLNYYMVH